MGGFLRGDYLRFFWRWIKSSFVDLDGWQNRVVLVWLEWVFKGRLIKHNSQLLKDLVGKDDVELYADSTYCSQEIEDYLSEIKCNSQVHEKIHLVSNKKPIITRNLKLGCEQHVFGFMTNSMNDVLHMRQIDRKRLVL